MKEITIVTHNGKFHADDVFGVATLFLVLEKKDQASHITIVRTRDEALMKDADFVLDVGAVYDEGANRFDHHQAGGAGMRANGVPYASFGLIWKKYGEQVAGSQAAAEVIDQKLVQPIDCQDNGIPLIEFLIEGVEPYQISDVVSSFLPVWDDAEQDFDARFKEAVGFAQALLKREILRSQSKVEAVARVQEIYQTSSDKQIIVLDHYMPWQDVLVEYPEPLYVVYPVVGDAGGERWHASVVPVKNEQFKARKDFPQAWAGKRDKELAEITGVTDALFCHNKLFLVSAITKEGALELAKKAVTA